MVHFKKSSQRQHFVFAHPKNVVGDRLAQDHLLIVCDTKRAVILG